MKLKIWPEDASMLQMNDWLAELREDAAEPSAAGQAEPASGGAWPEARTEPAALAEPASGGAWPEARTEPAALAEPASGGAWPEARTEPAALAESAAPTESAAATEFATFTEHAIPTGRAAPTHPAVPAEPAAPTHPAVPAEPAAPSEASVRPIIGDHLRMPTMWCEMGSCVSQHADPAALGEGDARARAIADGWRIDAFGRLACPQCQQTDPRFRAPEPVVQWDRYTALARTAQVAVAYGDRTARPQRF
jgi:hypothetical protein